MGQDCIFNIALTRVANIGSVQGKILIDTFGDAESIFKAKKSHLEKVEGIGTVRANSIKAFYDFNACEKEIQFIEKHQIKCLFYKNDDYPRRLIHCHDAPVLLYYKGHADCNHARILAIVGTRSNSNYGKQICESIINELQTQNIITISGLAYGIDTIAHQASLKNNIPTIAVLAHGLDRIYPYANRYLAKQMIDNGGLITAFGSNTNPDRQNFPSRNRITAGMADALLIIETGKRGGSLITAEIAHSYNKEIFAIPGRINDLKSAGCLSLIKQHKATLVESATDIVNHLNWSNDTAKKYRKQLSLFQELNEHQRKVISLFQQDSSMHIDQLINASNMTNSALASILLSLEMQDLIKSLPGNLFRLQ